MKKRKFKDIAFEYNILVVEILELICEIKENSYIKKGKEESFKNEVMNFSGSLVNVEEMQNYSEDDFYDLLCDVTYFSSSIPEIITEKLYEPLMRKLTRLQEIVEECFEKSK